MNIIDLIKANLAAAKLIVFGAIASAVVLAWLYHGHVKYEEGKASVQVLWDTEKAKQKEAADQENLRDEAARLATEAKHKKEIEYAKSQAGRIAIADWLKSHGLLPDGSPLRGSIGGGSEAEGAQVIDGASGQCRAGGSIEEFAGRCARDAITVESWQDWAKREGLEAE